MFAIRTNFGYKSGFSGTQQNPLEPDLHIERASLVHGLKNYFPIRFQRELNCRK